MPVAKISTTTRVQKVSAVPPPPAALYRPPPTRMWDKKGLNQSEEEWERDPNHLNGHLQVMWDDIIGEPQGLRSLDCTWNCSKCCFQKTLNCCYILMTLLYAPLFAFCAGCSFAAISFQSIWATGPGMRLCKINMAIVRKVNLVCMAAVCAPICETTGLLFSKLKLRTQTLSEIGKDDEDPDEIFLS